MIKINNKELIKELVGEIRDFPKYTTQLMNLANQDSQGTRPRVVGQLSDLIQECPEKTYGGWKEWYLKKHPDAIDNASDKIDDMVKKLKEAIEKIDKEMIKDWVEDLVLEKTFVGLIFQVAILKKIALIKSESYRLANSEEESKGIDGFVGETPISIKPITYNIKKGLNEKIEYKIVFYEKTKMGLKINADSVL